MGRRLRVGPFRPGRGTTSLPSTCVTFTPLTPTLSTPSLKPAGMFWMTRHWGLTMLLGSTPLGVGGHELAGTLDLVGGVLDRVLAVDLVGVEPGGLEDPLGVGIGRLGHGRGRGHRDDHAHGDDVGQELADTVGHRVSLLHARAGFASGSARSRRPWCGPRVRASRYRDFPPPHKPQAAEAARWGNWPQVSAHALCPLRRGRISAPLG